ncbi:hypothetical protein PBY51_013012 [Eleginops maclovinus]|uniref:Uncharacterized protein n=1 Tax=Eleginops maclovinus TaxID=56733 RepID=A0AAN7Y8Q2_ELEMC|nr:hypothetical protein PBY51_013012 [Eleginops maclovinus]
MRSSVQWGCQWFIQHFHFKIRTSLLVAGSRVGLFVCSVCDDRTDGEVACLGTAVGVRRVSVQLTCTRQLLVTGSCALQRFHSSSITVSPALESRADITSKGVFFHI